MELELNEDPEVPDDPLPLELLVLVELLTRYAVPLPLDPEAAFPPARELTELEDTEELLDPLDP